MCANWTMPLNHEALGLEQNQYLGLLPLRTESKLCNGNESLKTTLKTARIRSDVKDNQF
jgi:hypothetical protein